MLGEHEEGKFVSHEAQPNSLQNFSASSFGNSRREFLKFFNFNHVAKTKALKWGKKLYKLQFEKQI